MVPQLLWQPRRIRASVPFGADALLANARSLPSRRHGAGIARRSSAGAVPSRPAGLSPTRGAAARKVERVPERRSRTPIVPRRAGPGAAPAGEPRARLRSFHGAPSPPVPARGTTERGVNHLVVVIVAQALGEVQVGGVSGQRAARRGRVKSYIHAGALVPEVHLESRSGAAIDPPSGAFPGAGAVRGCGGRRYTGGGERRSPGGSRPPGGRRGGRAGGGLPVFKSSVPSHGLRLRIQEQLLYTKEPRARRGRTAGRPERRSLPGGCGAGAHSAGRQRSRRARGGGGGCNRAARARPLLPPPARCRPRRPVWGRAAARRARAAHGCPRSSEGAGEELSSRPDSLPSFGLRAVHFIDRYRCLARRGRSQGEAFLTRCQERDFNAAALQKPSWPPEDREGLSKNIP